MERTSSPFLCIDCLVEGSNHRLSTDPPNTDPNTMNLLNRPTQAFNASRCKAESVNATRVSRKMPRRMVQYGLDVCNPQCASGVPQRVAPIFSAGHSQTSPARLTEQESLNPLEDVCTNDDLRPIDTRSTGSLNSCTATCGCQSICSSHVPHSASSPPSTPFVPPIESVATVRWDSLAFANFSSFTAAGLEVENNFQATHVAISAANLPDIPAFHDSIEAVSTQTRELRPVNRVESLREQYLDVCFRQMREPLPNRSTGPSSRQKHPGEHSQAGHLGMRQPIPDSRSLQSVLHRLRESDQAVEPSNQLPSLLNQGVNFQLLDNSGSQETIHELKMMESLRSMAPGSTSIEGAAPQTASAIGKSNPTSNASTTTILPQSIIEHLFHSGLRGSLYRLLFPFTKPSLTKAEYGEALKCIRLCKAMSKAEENAKKRAKLQDKRRRKSAKSKYTGISTGLEDRMEYEFSYL